MSAEDRSLCDLVGSRICHDLISPIGAISNGVELISMSGDLGGPEMSLIAESVENANARIRFFRIAFGAAAPQQRIGRGEITGILRDLWRGGRLVIDWRPEGDLPRAEVKLAFLLLQCLEHAMPRGGRIAVSTAGGNWAVMGDADQVRLEPALWALLEGRGASAPLQASTVQFALAALVAGDMDRPLTVESAPNAVRVRF